MTNETKRPVLVWWLLWAAFQAGIFLIYHEFGNLIGQPEAPDREPPIWMAALAPVLVAAILRWLVLPWVRNAWIALALFIAGIFSAEVTCFLGLFIFPAHQQGLFMLSALGIFQFIPFFARRYCVVRDAQDQKPNLPG
jgi:hypothetical protein